MQKHHTHTTVFNITGLMHQNLCVKQVENISQLKCVKILQRVASGLQMEHASLTIKEGGLIYDTCWYPFMNSWDPATCCFLSTSRESPIHLWDAFNGELRATYRAYNQVDEVEASISAHFINSGTEIWAGFKNALRVFNVERPGRQINTIQLKKDFPNASGLISCIRENPIMPGLVAFGTYSKLIGLYRDGPLCTFKTGNGVTQIEFSACGTKMFSAVRRSNEFLCWDLRNPGVVLYSLQGRQSDTNQRIQFDIAPDGKQIVSGGTDGNIVVWELHQGTEYRDLNVMHKIQLSRDCINGISLHKSLPIIATSTGQRLCDNTMQYRDNNVRLWHVA
ncbi:telomerase Cajal body protein 1 homolog isoform X2 [Calliopsis andreniformis]|uniref:telomerase Cajal body protein 1 homolog isoform X2 n=1 Tax=Calliopsis andreniformis TaxID=337506 RepID=UPI003FCCEF6A